jgi:hypothetical protein
LWQRALAVAAVGAAVWTSLTLRLDLRQHPKLVKHASRMPSAAPRPARAWRRLRRAWRDLLVEQRSARTVWLRLEGRLSCADARRLGDGVGTALRRTRDHLVLDVERLIGFEHEAAALLAERLGEFRQRIRILAPVELSRGAATALAMFTPYAGAIA